ncbi:MAG TPA: hypothetical protein VGC26_04960 [Afipia sp.]
MDDDKPGGTPDDAPRLPPRGKRKRPGPTIELTATDVSDADNAPSVDASADKTAADKTSEDKISSGEKSSHWRERMKGFSLPSYSWPSWSRPSFGRGAGGGSLLAPVLTSAAVAALIAGAALLIGRPAGPVANSAAPSDSALIDALRGRIAALESRSGQPASADPVLPAKIAGIEKSLASLRDDIGKLRTQTDSATAGIDALKAARQDSVPAAVDTAALEDRLTKLERATVALTADTPVRPAPAAPADPTVPRVAAAALLDQIVHQAQPYEAALSNARKFGDTGALKALEPFAATGVPTARVLSRELLALLPQLAPKPDTAPATGGILQRLQQGALKLVRVRRIDDAQSDDLVSRVKDFAQREDIAEAKKLLLTLPESERAPVQPWIDKANARDAALAAASRYAQDAMSVMPRPADSQ